MAHGESNRKEWDDIEDQFYSSASHSDDSPILSHSYPGQIYPRARYKVQEPVHFRFSRICLFCSAMILFCVLMYIPVYHKANYHIPKGVVAGWTVHTNRDTKLYVQPNNVTTIYNPKNVCDSNKKNKLLLLVIVCSATQNVEIRNAIRETWGNYENYKQDSKIFHEIRNKYKNYDYTHDLYPNLADITLNNLTNENATYNVEVTTQNRTKRDISSLNQLLPVLAKALSNVNLTKTEPVPEKRFEVDEEPLIPEFDMNKEIGGQTESDAEIIDYDNDYQSNIMRIPPKGYEDESPIPDLTKIFNLLKQTKNFEKIKDLQESDNPEFKVVFLLGLPEKKNKTLQKKIDEEVEKYGDIIQEGFIDSYNNLTLKSIMMLKWVTNKCNDSVRYILKLDDDVYVNVPNLILNLRNRSEDYDKKASMGLSLGPEYLLIGTLISGARPVLNAHNKWYSPRYMYGGRVYPRYLSGSGYAMSLPTAHALYAAALRTRYFHLEDIYITGMCSLRAQPRIFPRDDRQFSYVSVRKANMACWAHSLATMHRVTPRDMHEARASLLQPRVRDRCERMRLTQIRRDRLKQLKKKPKKPVTHIKTP